MVSRRPWRIGLLVLAVLVVAAVLWYAYLTVRVVGDLNAAVGDARSARSALENGDTEKAKPYLDDLADRSTSAAKRTDGVSWGLLTHLPVIGDDARGVRTVSGVVSDLSGTGIDQLLQAADSIDDLAPKNGRIDLATVKQLQRPIGTAAAAMAQADDQLSAEDSSGFVGRFKTQYDDLASEVGTADRALSAADKAVTVMPSMLGADGPKEYLLVFQNNAEIRATGGLPGSAALLRADDGKVQLVRQVAGNSFGERPSPVLSLSPGEKSLYTEKLGTYFLDANFTPDFQRAAQLWTARWEERYPSDQLDGVMTLDTVALSYLMRGMQPVTVQGVQLTSDNIVDELLHQVYLRFEDPAKQDAFFQQAAQQVFSTATSGSVEPRKLLPALRDAADQGRALVAVDDKEVAAELEGTAVLGRSLTSEADAGTYFVGINDGQADKLSYYLRYSARLDATYCSDDTQAGTMHLQLRSTAPKSVATQPRYIVGEAPPGYPQGTQILTVRLYTPPGGRFGDAQLNGAPTQIKYQQFGDRVVGTVFVPIQPGTTSDLVLRTTAPANGATGVWSTPSIDGSGGYTAARSSCG
ncbi:DUF4012 domain-containing protein [Nocardioides acrostichi]|uniref:DUF4012 domain-containing protein n=1 Tax=Nocardioides acrostichi TaxID=2784339 RepID=A0A930V2G8_9ACTN|nr:DUF4012 domain-containing protein [Nocardioides acrostichi]MBF4162525.1 DUF4012 domain-containing protein [Nocardioides acrostichi]